MKTQSKDQIFFIPLSRDLYKVSFWIFLASWAKPHSALRSVLNEWPMVAPCHLPRCPIKTDYRWSLKCSVKQSFQITNPSSSDSGHHSSIETPIILHSSPIILHRSIESLLEVSRRSPTVTTSRGSRNKEPGLFQRFWQVIPLWVQYYQPLPALYIQYFVVIAVVTTRSDDWLYERLKLDQKTSLLASAKYRNNQHTRQTKTTSDSPEPQVLIYKI